MQRRWHEVTAPMKSNIFGCRSLFIRDTFRNKTIMWGLLLNYTKKRNSRVFIFFFLFLFFFLFSGGMICTSCLNESITSSEYSCLENTLTATSWKENGYHLNPDKLIIIITIFLGSFSCQSNAKDNLADRDPSATSFFQKSKNKVESKRHSHAKSRLDVMSMPGKFIWLFSIQTLAECNSSFIQFSISIIYRMKNQWLG